MYKTETINIYCRLILAPVKLTPSNSFSLELGDMVSVSALCCNPEGYKEKLAKTNIGLLLGQQLSIVK